MASTYDENGDDGISVCSLFDCDKSSTKHGPLSKDLRYLNNICPQLPKEVVKRNQLLQVEGLESVSYKSSLLVECVKRRSKMDITNVLPAECISHIISLTTPRDACRLAVVSGVFKSAADSDLVWQKFLPFDYKLIISNSVSSLSLITSFSKKDLYFHLCQHPIFINNGTMSFALEKETGKKCYMVGARGLCIGWGSTPNCRKWTSLPESRFPEVAQPVYFWFFEVNTRIETRILSHRTNYAAYLVFKFGESIDRFRRRHFASRVYAEGTNDKGRQSLFLDPSRNMPQLFHDRSDGWMEIEIGEFFNKIGDDGTLVCNLLDHDKFGTRHCLVIEGIELRPKKG